MTKKLNDEKRISFHKIRYESKIRKLTLKSMEKIIGNKVLFKKLDSFFKLSLNNLNQKNSNLLN